MRLAHSLILIILGVVLQGQGVPQSGYPGGTSSSSSVSLGQLQTTAPLYLYSDPLGSDSNACTSTGVGACLTCQGACNKVPKFAKHSVIVTIGTGDQAGCICNSPIFSTTDLPTSGTTPGPGFLVQGTLVNATLGSGTATGTATSMTNASGVTQATLTDSTQSWTVNALTGLVLDLPNTAAAEHEYYICSNTATVITLCTGWTSGITATPAYSIKDFATNLNVSATRPNTVAANAADRKSVV